MSTPGLPVDGREDDSAEEAAPDDDTASDEEPADEDEGSGDDGSGADNKPPVLESLRFDPAQVEGGGVTTLTVQASDARSGVKSIWGEVRSPNKLAVLSFGSPSLAGRTVFSFPITLPRQAETGTWYVSWIALTDGADNRNLIQAASAAAAPSGGTFAAFSPESDATPPEVLQVWFEKSAVGPGEKNTIVVQARDDRSGVASMTGAVQSPSKSAQIWFNGTMNADTEAWTGEFTIPRTADCGEWSIQRLAVKDKAENTALLQAASPLLARAGFRVSSGSDCDFTAPTLEAFELAPAFVVSGTATEILVTATIYEAGSGVATVSGWFEGPAPPGGHPATNNFSCTPDPREPGSQWTCRIQVPALAARGTWRVGSIRLEDRARNSRTYTSSDAVVSGRTFKVQ